MLVLTRKLGEQIQIDGCIEVTVLGVEGHRVRLGIKAPSDVTIRRRELVFDRDDGLLRIEQRIFGITSPVELWWGIQPISAGLFGVPLGFAVIIIVSLLTPAPQRNIQELVEHVRYLAEHSRRPVFVGPNAGLPRYSLRWKLYRGRPGHATAPSAQNSGRALEGVPPPNHVPASRSATWRHPAGSRFMR